jgi:hypothetical protein
LAASVRSSCVREIVATPVICTLLNFLALATLQTYCQTVNRYDGCLSSRKRAGLPFRPNGESLAQARPHGGGNHL